MQKLSDYFKGVMLKKLSAVETNPETSNQHEFNGTARMKMHLGDARRELPASFIYLGKQEGELIKIQDVVTWYDARAKHPVRSEYRLYFRDNVVMESSNEGDLLVVAIRNDGSIVLLVVDGSSDHLSEVLWLFGAGDKSFDDKLDIDTQSVAPQSFLLFHHIADAIGIEIDEVADNWLDLLLERFGAEFPRTRDLSLLAWETLQADISLVEAPDNALLQLMDREELLFRQLERHIVSKHLSQNASDWADDVDAFISFSLSVQNRRKSRAGHALENQLERVLIEHEVAFDRGVVTELRSKPDFLFPGGTQYHDDAVPSHFLAMLGVKTTCKDRWRQVLTEAARIKDKHLLTLQPGISEHQTSEMRDACLNLVVPGPLHASYTREQSEWLMSLGDFIALVKEREICRMS